MVSNKWSKDSQIMSYVNAKLGKQSDGLKAFQISSVIQLKVNKRCTLFVHSVSADIC